MAVLDSLMKLYPFQIVYMADIDAILGLNSHMPLIQTLCEAYPDTTFWLDSGINDVQDLARLDAYANIKPVIGSENITSLEKYQAIQAQYPDAYVLSLDHAGDKRLGLIELHEQAAYWPKDIICMTLEAVGSQQGVAVHPLHAVAARGKALSKTIALYAAGGVRHINDIKSLQSCGIEGVLVATALHQSLITQQDLIAFYGTK